MVSVVNSINIQQRNNTNLIVNFFFLVESREESNTPELIAGGQHKPNTKIGNKTTNKP